MDKGHSRSNLSRYRIHQNASVLNSGTQPSPRPPTSNSHRGPSTRPTQRPPLQAGQLNTTSNPSNGVQIPTTPSGSVPAPPPVRLSSQTRAAPSMPPSDRCDTSLLLMQQISPLLAVIQDQQTTILTHIANSDHALRHLGAEVEKLTENAKQKEDKEAKDHKVKEGREKEYLKAIGHLAQRVDDVRKCVAGIDTVVGGQEDGGRTMFDRLNNLEMDVGELLERVRDPDAAAIADDRSVSSLPPTPSFLATAPTPVRHDLATSPSQNNQAVSTTPKEPSSVLPSTKINVATQADAALELPTQEPTESGALCASCSKTLSLSHSPVNGPPANPHSYDIDMDDSTSVSSASKGKEVERISMQDSPPSYQVGDHQFVIPPLAESSSAGPISQPLSPSLLPGNVPEMEIDLATSSQSGTQSAYNLSDHRDNESSVIPESNKCSLAKPSNSQEAFSPVDWSKAPASSSDIERSSGAPLPYAVTQSRGKSYTLPPLPEGTVAALRKEALVDPHPYPLESTVLGDGNRVVPTTAGVMGASVEAARRMLSPESQSEGDDMGDDDTLEQKQKSPEVQVIQRLESARSICPSPLPATSQSNGLGVAQDAEETTETNRIQPMQTNDLILLDPSGISSRNNVSESSLTTLSYSSISTSDMENSIIHNQDSTSTKAPSPELIQKPTPITTEQQTDSLLSLPKDPLSQASGTTEDEDAVMSLVVDISPTSPATASLSQIPPTASPVIFSTPNPNNSESIDTNHNPEDNDLGNLTKLQEWYRQRGLKVLDKQENVGTVSPADLSTTQNYACDDFTADDNYPPLSPLSPLFSSPSVTPSQHAGEADLVHLAEPTAFLKKLAEKLDDDDVDIVPAKRNRTSSTAIGSATRPRVGFEKQSITPSRPPQKSIATIQKKAQPSKAKTRIKRRKVSQESAKQEMDSEDEEDQPPLKRVKLRIRPPSSRNHKIPHKVPQTVTPTKRLPRTAAVTWPKIDKPVFDQFIECDSCDQWYHVGCVGVQPDDIRLSPSEIYQCPPCEAGIFRENTQASQKAVCARPKCLCPTEVRTVKKEATFVVESFVGMVKRAVGGRGVQLVYLVKWLGYDFGDATWEEEHAMGLPNPAFFIDKFEKQARKEGLDISQHSQAVLLKCASDAGWNPNGLFTKRDT